MNKFFSHENHHFSPSPSEWGKLHFGKKSNLLEVLVHDVHGEPPNFIGCCTYYPLSMFQHLMNMLIKSFFHTYQNNWKVVHELI